MSNPEIILQKGATHHKEQLHQLYLKVAGLPDGIIRTKNEIDENYINDFLSHSLKNGLIILAFSNEIVVGEIHAYTPNIYAFQHLLTDLTIVVDPDYQGMGIGRKLFDTFLEIVKDEYLHILRIELFVREHNLKNVKFYEKLGFINEGRQLKKIFKSKGELETPLHMAWFNPCYLPG